MTSRPYITRVELDPCTAKLLKAYARNAGMTQTVVLSRIVEWYVNQPAAIQKLILLPDTLCDDRRLALLIFNRLAKRTRP